MPSKDLSPALLARIEEEGRTGTFTDFSCHNADVIRRKPVAADNARIWRPAFARDIDKIMYCPYYARYADKTQVFSLFKNDDISRRSLHVQLVSRIARTIGSALHLNLDLIEAISIGHDIGHPPFAHTGEKYLDELYFAHCGRHFYHSIHSARVLDKIFPYNLSLQTLNGIAAHNGELELETYIPEPTTFEQYDEIIEACYLDKAATARLVPATLEAAVMRISDIIAYLGRDRQDAVTTKIISWDTFEDGILGTLNAEIINSLVVNIIENSYGKPYIKMDQEHFRALERAKKENYALIYENTSSRPQLHTTVKPMMAELYDKLLQDIMTGNRTSPIFTHHIAYVNRLYTKPREIPYEMSDPNDIVVDYIASMTDDYFIDLHRHLFPNSPYTVAYRGYFD